MKPVTLSLQISLAQILSLLAVVTTIFLARISTLQDLKDELIRIWKFRQTGFSPNWVQRSFYLRLIDAALWIFCFVSIAQFYVKVSDYLFLMDNLVGIAAALDYGLLTRLSLHAGQVKHSAIRLGFQTLWLLGIRFTFTLLLTARSVGTKPACSHPYGLPAEWAAAPAAMWEQRIEQAAFLLCSDSPALANELAAARLGGTWRSDWKVWTKCVIGYHIAATRMFRDQPEGARSTSGQS